MAYPRSILSGSCGVSVDPQTESYGFAGSGLACERASRAARTAARVILSMLFELLDSFSPNAAG